MPIGFGGGCHWCTEAVFQSLRGATKVQSGFIKSDAPHDTFSEAVIVTYDPSVISLDVLIEVHLRTHASTSSHKMRGKYRSAIYVFEDAQIPVIHEKLTVLAPEFDAPIVTQVLPYREFEAVQECFEDYYLSNKGKPFCETYIDPKLSEIRRRFTTYYEPIGA